ncbi:hypothetical protein [Kribbella sp. NPDC004875]|uniref:hypothetical protein n=1 Tax=Kribbella sp. NPDC004875 TaxID=3364107 RepID=UPI0036CC667F
MITVGGTDTYFDYDERQWKFRRLGGGPIRPGAPCPGKRRDDLVAPAQTPAAEVPLEDTAAETTR